MLLTASWLSRELGDCWVARSLSLLLLCQIPERLFFSSHPRSAFAICHLPFATSSSWTGSKHQRALRLLVAFVLAFSFRLVHHQRAPLRFLSPLQSQPFLVSHTGPLVATVVPGPAVLTSGCTSSDNTASPSSYAQGRRTPAMPVLPSTGPTAAARLVIRATESSHASASASQANYVDHMHHDIHGSQVWHWDGQSSINLIFIVAFLGALILVFMGLVLLSRLLARTNAPSGDDALPFRRPTSVPIMVQPHMAQVPRVDRSPFDEVRKPFADDPKGSFPSLPSTPRYHSNVSTPNESAASSSQNVIAPLLSSFPLGNKRGTYPVFPFLFLGPCNVGWH